MEVMEDGNLMDKVHILIQRDMEYYNDKQTVLQETICPGVVGGKLDFPRSASFAAVKLVLWWEEEYVAAYRKGSGFLEKKSNIEQNFETSGGCGGIVKTSDPSKFVSLISKSADELLEHLHILTQEALDHADLTVLTGTIGASALLKNCLWFYIHSANESKDFSVQLQDVCKKYKEMGEALAERLLDLHCRLLALYILQDADSLDWESQKPFCESERGSYVIQMWWLYMKGTKEDLWNTVPPKMAQRVFAGILNETLTILTVRYIQSCPSEARNQLLIVDISNLLLCVAQLLPAICDQSDHFLGFSTNKKNKILKDIHTKCQELLNCLILRGSSISMLHKIFRNGLDGAEIFKPRNIGPMPWVTFALPNMFQTYPKAILSMSNLPTDIAVASELMILIAQPQANWALLLKVLAMRNCKILNMILELSLENYKSALEIPQESTKTCEAFLCTSDGSCQNFEDSLSEPTQIYYYELIASVTNVILHIGNNDDYSDILLAAISRQPNWFKCFDRRHIWNQIRPPWFEAILELVKPILPTITKTVINAIQTGASMYQAMLIILVCFSQLWDCVNISLAKISLLIQDLLPPEVISLNNSVLIQILVSALYSDLLKKSKKFKKEVTFFDEAESSTCNQNSEFGSEEEIALAIAESLCTIDEDNKHTDQIEEFLDQVKNSLKILDFSHEGSNRIEVMPQTAEVLVSDILMAMSGKKSLKILYNFVKNNNEWIFQKINVSPEQGLTEPNKMAYKPKTLLYTMFHIGYRPFDQVNIHFGNPNFLVKLLTGEWVPNWINLLQTPMGLSVDRIWSQISLRWDFRNVNSFSLSAHDIQIINKLTSLFKQN